jgi:hexosaminidase
LEPIKGYKRHEEPFTTLTPFNRLVDAIPPESAAARHFRKEVDRYLAGPRTGTTVLRKALTTWWENADTIRPALQRNSLLREQIPVANAITTICQAGLDALSLLENNSAALPGWQKKTSEAVRKAAEPGAALMIQIAPGVEKLIAAVKAPPAQQAQP